MLRSCVTRSFPETLVERSFPDLERLEKTIRDLFLSFEGQCQTPTRKFSFSGGTWRSTGSRFCPQSLSVGIYFPSSLVSLISVGTACHRSGLHSVDPAGLFGSQSPPHPLSPEVLSDGPFCDMHFAPLNRLLLPQHSLLWGSCSPRHPLFFLVQGLSMVGGWGWSLYPLTCWLLPSAWCLVVLAMLW